MVIHSPGQAHTERHGPFWREWVTYTRSLHFCLLYSINSAGYLTDLRDVYFAKVLSSFLFFCFRSDKPNHRSNYSGEFRYRIVEASSDVDVESSAIWHWLVFRCHEVLRIATIPDSAIVRTTLHESCFILYFFFSIRTFQSHELWSMGLFHCPNVILTF